jgi:hypothetical protein
MWSGPVLPLLDALPPDLHKEAVVGSPGAGHELHFEQTTLTVALG